MISVIIWSLMLFALVGAPVIAFRSVFVGRTGRGWLMPLAVAGTGIALIVWLGLVSASEQSRLFGSIIFLLGFGFAAAVTIVACLLGHGARLIAARRARKGEG
jgi:hypothetical protein